MVFERASENHQDTLMPDLGTHDAGFNVAIKCACIFYEIRHIYFLRACRNHVTLILSVSELGEGSREPAALDR